MTIAEYKLRFPTHPIMDQESAARSADAARQRNRAKVGTPRPREVVEKIKATKAANPRPAWNKGVPRTPEQNAHMSAVMKAKYASGEVTHWNLGRTTSDAVKAKISAALTKDTPRKKYVRKHTPSLSHTAMNAAIARAEDRGLKVLSIIPRAHSRVELQCTTCDTVFTCMRQALDERRLAPVGVSQICPGCHPRHQSRASSLEATVQGWLEEWGVAYRKNTRHVIPPKELDFYVPDKNIAIEVNGLYWHSELVVKAAGYPKTKDYEKMVACIESGVRLITIYEDEILHAPSIVKARLRHALGLTTERVYARNTTIREISPTVANRFLNTYHLQGSGRSTHRWGMFLGEELIGVLTLLVGNDISKGQKNSVELNRLAFSGSVIGGFSKFMAAVARAGFTHVRSFVDRRWNDGHGYSAVGFTHIRNTAPNYWYFNPNELVRYHRYGFRKGARVGDDPTKTEFENRTDQGWLRIWDCGSSVWEWKA